MKPRTTRKSFPLAESGGYAPYLTLPDGLPTLESVSNDPKQRPTQMDVARIAKVHRSTVSLALKRHPNIASETCDRIKKIAEDIGYLPDPMLTALAAYRHKKHDASFQGTLAWLVNTAPNFQWKKLIYRRFYEAAKDQARTHGYGIETFDLAEKGLSTNRLSQILRSRNIQGILVCPQPDPHMEIDFSWEHFSAITFGFSLKKPRLHTVAPYQYDAAIIVVRKLYAAGHERIGYLSIHDDRMNNHILSGFLSETFIAQKAIKTPPLHPTECHPRGIAKWYKRYRPTALIGPPDIEERIREAGLPVDELVLTCAFLPHSHWDLSGVYEDAEQIGRVAADNLVSMIQQGERGIPETFRITLVKGKWIENRPLTPFGQKPALQSAASPSREAVASI
ncbi:LacI family DNA-binding transcriptional regulator [Ruficoccus amylovorans]|uniref:LacI family DNA-binding transcriptional regulator n=1 Tax=Ruficoccus amylovorans TaxID=1804625 RepID=A0A842HIV9_9BACT|nr:LacI family DNA-binding transcriptional regulator [Ruficoccus amylovorans]MBC2595918.1 LacI family DNA-binding transcriptional regulator [Ruficoccus amylovorans]